MKKALKRTFPNEDPQILEDSVHPSLVDTITEKARDQLSITTDPKETADKQDIDRLTTFVLRVALDSLKITAAKYFAKVSPVVSDIAETFNVPPGLVMEWAKTKEWEEYVRSYGWKGDVQPLVSKNDLRVPVPLRESFLLKQVFQKYSRVRFVTYDGFIDAKVTEIGKYDLFLDDGRRLKKIDVILAFPEDRMPDIRRGIKRRNSIAEKNLKPIRRRSDRPKINVAAHIGDPIECVMRDGLVVIGENIWISEYNIVMRVGGKKGEGGKVILLYKHALYDFNVLNDPSQSQQITGNDFDAEDSQNHQES